jgi:hypothetical protein
MPAFKGRQAALDFAAPPWTESSVVVAAAVANRLVVLPRIIQEGADLTRPRKSR